MCGMSVIRRMTDPEPELVPVGSGDFRLVTLNQN
ncbi:hypothetical protein EMIT0111MI5_250020 [Burkholderia sp. IT-111MI5]